MHEFTILVLVILQTVPSAAAMRSIASFVSPGLGGPGSQGMGVGRGQGLSRARFFSAAHARPRVPDDAWRPNGGSPGAGAGSVADGGLRLVLALVFGCWVLVQALRAAGPGAARHAPWRGLLGHVEHLPRLLLVRSLQQGENGSA